MRENEKERKRGIVMERERERERERDREREREREICKLKCLLYNVVSNSGLCFQKHFPGTGLGGNHQGWDITLVYNA